MESGTQATTDPLDDVTDPELAQAIDDLLRAGALVLASCPRCGGLRLVPRSDEHS